MWWLAVFAELTSAQTGSLRIVERVDPITDNKSIYAVVGTPEQHLALGCDDARARSVRVVAHFKQYIGDAKPGIIAGGADFQYHFDKRPPISARWYSHDQEVTAEEEITRPLRFILDMKGSTSIYLRARNYDGDAFDMQFTYENATPTIEQMLVACGLSADGAK